MFSIGEAIRVGWRITKGHWLFFIGILFSAWAISFAPLIFAVLTQEKLPFLSPIFSIGGWVLQTVTGMGLILISIKFSRNEKGAFADLFACFPHFLAYLLGSILYALIVLAGGILLLIPGIIWAIQFQFFVYFIIDKNLGPIEALKKSSAITKGSRWKLFSLGLVIAGINLLGLLCLGVGLLMTIPISMVALAATYQKLSEPQ